MREAGKGKKIGGDSELVSSSNRLIRRGVRGGGFYGVDNKTGKRTSLRIDSEDKARQIIEARTRAKDWPPISFHRSKAFHTKPSLKMREKVMGA